MYNRYFTLSHDFGQYNEEVKNYLRYVYIGSLNFYEATYLDYKPTGTEDLDLYTIDRTIGYLEDYLYYYFRIYPKYFLDVFNALNKNVNKISVLEPAKRGLYGEYVSSFGIVYVNPELSRSKTLSKDERTRLYVCHELGHAVNHEWIKTLNNYIKDDNPSVKEFTLEGFSLIDEATTQNMAENIAYSYSSSNRPRQRINKSSMYNGEVYRSNFDFYGELQEPATLFAKTLRGIGDQDNDDVALDFLSLRALKKDFANSIFYEYFRDGHESDLYYLMTYLGVIKKASYATFGYEDKKYINASESAMRELRKLAGCLRDPRPPFRR